MSEGSYPKKRNQMRRSVIVFLDYYLPGSKGGGPIRSLKNLVGALGHEIRFSIVTRDRDLGAAGPYEIPLRNQPISTPYGVVTYLSRGPSGLIAQFRELLKNRDAILYLNSFFSWRFSILPLLVVKCLPGPERPVLIAPRGEMSSSALGIKRWKKRAYLKIASLMGLYKNCYWHASSELEKRDIEAIITKGMPPSIARPLAEMRTKVAPDLGDDPALAGPNINRWAGKKVAGELNLIFIARIVRIKNLHFALEALRMVKAKVVFRIYGPVEDENYWKLCQKSLACLPRNVTVAYCGALSPDGIPGALHWAHLYILPSLSENFGHGILEALLSGCPVLIGDKTYWQNLQRIQAGWVLPLGDARPFAQVIDTVAGMDSEEHRGWSESAKCFGVRMSRSEDALRENQRLFDDIYESAVSDN